MDLSSGVWHGEPPRWRIDAGHLQATSGQKTDFWRKTHYGFLRDNGHFLGFEAAPEFTAQVTVDGAFEHLYDQAGLMLRIDADRWVKAGAEWTDGALRLSCVVTDGCSDWSVGRDLGKGRRFGVRLSLSGKALRVQASADLRHWELIRLAPFAAPRPPAIMRVGPMFCSPERAGLEVHFADFTLGPPITTGLHDPL